MLVVNGREYARVTEILAPYSDYSHIDPAVLRRKCDIGTDIHAAIESHLSGSMPIPCVAGVGYFESYMHWYKTVAPKVIYTEQRYCCDTYLITGQVDLVCTIKGSNIPLLIDFKTAAAESKEVWPMQAHLYAYLLSVNNVNVGKKYIFLKLDKQGKAPTAHTYSWDKNIHSKCVVAVNNFWHKKKK